MRPLPIALASLFVLTACGGGGGGGGGEPPAEPNDPPLLAPAPGLSGGPVQFNYVLATGATDSLTFTATDPNADTLTWNVAVSGSAQTAAGLTFASPVTGPTFTIDLAAVAAPASASLNLLVEDPRGGAAAIDILFVRSGAPTITGVTPSSAFVSAPQGATITGTSLLLGNAVNTTASFGGAAAGDVTVVNDSTLTCTTPSPGLLGANSVGVQNAFGSDALPGNAFTMYQYPVDLFAADVALDAGAGSQLVTANEGATLQAVWVEAGALVHQRSIDGGATWSAPQTLSSGEVPSAAQISMLGDELVVAWVGNGTDMLARASLDGGQTFDAAVTLNPAAGGATVSRPRLARAGSRVYCAWLQGSFGLGQQRVHATSTPNNGGVWQTGGVVSEQGANQEMHAIGCNQTAAWIAFGSAPGTGPGVYTSRSTDGGILWTAGVLRSAVSIGIGDISLCNDGARVNLVWVRDGQLQYMISENSALGWPTLPSVFRPNDIGTIFDVTVVCEGDRLFAAYLAGQNVAFSRIGGAGALPEHVTLSDTVESPSRPALQASGNYLFAAWRGGLVGGGTGPGRIKFASSVDLGVTFTPPVTFGDGTAAQDLPQLLVDSARVWIGWLDYRGATPALFSNRTEG
ncbi:MAG: IPT/TIG domain-containing protein [Planctomycetota bacterium]